MATKTDANGMLHGTLDALILKTLTWGVRHGYGIARWLEFVALAIFAYEITHSPELVALLAVLRMVPYLLLGFLTGALADVVDRMAQRDRVDGSRAVAPMARAQDAVDVQSDGVSPLQVIEQIAELARARGAPAVSREPRASA